MSQVTLADNGVFFAGEKLRCTVSFKNRPECVSHGGSQFSTAKSERRLTASLDSLFSGTFPPESIVPASPPRQADSVEQTAVLAWATAQLIGYCSVNDQFVNKNAFISATHHLHIPKMNTSFPNVLTNLSMSCFAI